MRVAGDRQPNFKLAAAMDLIGFSNKRDAEAAAHHAHQALDALPGIRSRRSWHQTGHQVDVLASTLPRDPRIADLRDHWQQVKAG